jgi:hypothetical protein
MGGKVGKVPQGTTELFFRPSGTLFRKMRAIHSAKALGYFQKHPPARLLYQPNG